MSLTDNFDSLMNGGLRDVSQEHSISTQQGNIEKYRKASRVRNICFVQPNGRSLFLNYSYMISGEFLPDESAVNMVFTTHDIVLRGFNLKDFFENLMMHLPRKIVAINPRYSSMTDKEGPIIAEIIISEKP